MRDPLPRATFSLSAEEVIRISSASAALDGTPYTQGANLEPFILSSLAIMHRLPLHLLKALMEFRSRRDHEGVVLIRGLPVPQVPPTPNGWAATPASKLTFETEGILIGIMLLLGEPFAFSSQQGGHLIQNIVPALGMEASQTSQGSMAFLEWHVEDAFTPWRSDFVGLLCLRSAPDARTGYASVNDMRLTPDTHGTLFEARFMSAPDEAHEALASVDTDMTSVLYGSHESPFIRYDPIFMKAADHDLPAIRALAALAEEIQHCARYVALQVGDLLIIDNHRTVHGRTPFTPKFDGTDRWLQRVQIQSDFRELQIAASWGAGARTVDPFLHKRVRLPNHLIAESPQSQG